MMNYLMKPDADSEIIKNTLDELRRDFITNYKLAYGSSVGHLIKQELHPTTEVPDGLKLLAAPLPSEPIKCAYIFKRGDSIKTWKKRWLIASNAADNYKLDYYETQNGKHKGTILGANYGVQRINVDEEGENGPFGIKLVPLLYERSRRTWYMRCDTEEERRQWIHVLELCCWKNCAPVDRALTPCMCLSFEVALRQTRQQRSHWGFFRSYGTETERLTDIFTEIALNTLDSAIESSPTRGTRLEKATAKVEGLVRTSVSQTWTSVQSASVELSEQLEGTVHCHASRVYEYEATLKNSVLSLVGPAIENFLAAQHGKLFEPIVTELKDVLPLAFIQARTGLCAVVARDGAVTNLDARNSTLATLLAETSNALSGHLHEPYLTLSGLFSDPFAHVAAAKCLPTGFTPTDLQMMCMDGLRRLSASFVYTLGHRCDMLGDPTNIMACVQSTLDDYLCDARRIMLHTVLEIIRLAVSEPIDRELIPFCETSGASAGKSSGGGLKAAYDLLAAGNARLPGLAQLFPVTHLLREVCRERVAAGALIQVEDRVREGIDGHIQRLIPGMLEPEQSFGSRR